VQAFGSLYARAHLVFGLSLYRFGHDFLQI